MKNEDIEHKSSAKMIIFVTLFLSLIYVVLRYHIFGGVSWEEFPLFILNKGLSLAGFLLITYNFSFGPIKNIGVKVPDSWLDARNTLAMIGFLLLLLHALISFLLFSPEYYAEFFEENGKLTLLASLSILFGVVGFVLLWMINMTFQTYMRENDIFVKFISSRSFLLAALTLGGLHLALMGYKGWLTPALWHGGLPPVSLLAFFFFAAGYLANVWGRK